MRRKNRALEETSYLYDTVIPISTGKEPLYSILRFLARHGFELVDQLYDSVKLDCPDHILLQV